MRVRRDDAERSCGFRRFGLFLLRGGQGLPLGEAVSRPSRQAVSLRAGGVAPLENGSGAGSSGPVPLMAHTRDHIQFGKERK